VKKAIVLDHEPPPIDPSADSFRGFERAFKAAQVQQKQELKREATDHQQEQVKAIVEGEISDAAWDELVAKARVASERGEKQYLLLRFPSDVCSDAARAINNPPNPGWPRTLRGEAADIYQRWQMALRPHGFDLFAQVLDFPGGRPGDVGLFLRWGE